MAMQEQGIKGERLARAYMKRKGYKNFFQPDALCRGDDGKWFIIESKYKKMFHGWAGFCGTGLSMRQVNVRMKLFEETGIRTKFIAFDSDEHSGSSLNRTTYVYTGWIDELMQATEPDRITVHANNKNEDVTIFSKDILNVEPFAYSDRQLGMV